MGGAGPWPGCNQVLALWGQGDIPVWLDISRDSVQHQTRSERQKPQTTFPQADNVKALRLLVLCPEATATCCGNKDLCPEVAISVIMFLSKESLRGL